MERKQQNTLAQVSHVSAWAVLALVLVTSSVATLPALCATLQQLTVSLAASSLALL